MKKFLLALLTVIMLLGNALTCIAQSSEENAAILPELNEEGYFATAFCRELDLTRVFTSWSEACQSLFPGEEYPEEMTIINNVKNQGEVYEYASLTFYPDGRVLQKYKLTDKIYQAFSKNWLFALAVKQEKHSVGTYSVDMTNHSVTVTIDNEVHSLILDTDAFVFTMDNMISDERFELPGEVEELENPEEPGENPAEPGENPEEPGEKSEEPGENPEEPVMEPYTLLQDVSYGPHVRNTMDVFVPNTLDKKNANGAFLLIYGGGWTGGDKSDEQIQKLAREYAKAGYTAVAINMRNVTTDEVTGKTVTTVYDMLNDVQGSVRKLKELSEENGWNITQIATKGFSSGGNIALLYAYSRGSGVPYFDTEEIFPVRFVADVVGPVDMHDEAWASDPEWIGLEEIRLVEPGAGPLFALLLTGTANQEGSVTEDGTINLSEEALEECINSMSPVWYVDEFSGIPTVMGYSAQDIIQNPNNGKRLKGHLDAQGVRNDLYTFQNSIHGYASDPEQAQAYFDKTIEYAQTYFSDDTQKPDIEGPVTPQEPDESYPGTKNQDPLQETVPQIPKTGDSFSATVFMGMLGMAVGVLIVLLKKQKNRRNV